MILDIDKNKTTETYVSETPHELQTVDIYRPSETSTAQWIIFIHGGAWRDPKMTSSAAHMLFTHLLSSPLLTDANAASVNYRLSPHSSYPDLASNNSAKHPDHLEDVMTALRYLHRVYLMNEYILVGHSAGATLAFQVLSRLQDDRSVNGLALPSAIFGVEGIYGLTSLVDEYPDYAAFIEAAFGEGRNDAWEGASPSVQGLRGYKGMVVLAQSDEDELLSWRQTEEMKQRCEETLGVGGEIRVIKLIGSHNGVLEEERLAEVVTRYI